MENDDQAKNQERCKTYSADEARQGEIILRSRRSRIIFVAGLAAFALLAVALGLLTGIRP
jgi:hypothetical protein